LAGAAALEAAGAAVAVDADALEEAWLVADADAVEAVWGLAKNAGFRMEPFEALDEMLPMSMAAPP
jgi:hypothetical protein